MTTGQVAKVMNDTVTNNGDYRYNGTAWVKGYDALIDAKNFTIDVVTNNKNVPSYFFHYVRKTPFVRMLLLTKGGDLIMPNDLLF